jgi:hypothetical protein
MAKEKAIAAPYETPGANYGPLHDSNALDKITELLTEIRDALKKQAAKKV